MSLTTHQRPTQDRKGGFISLDLVCLNVYNELPTTIHVRVVRASLDPSDNEFRLLLGDYRVTVEFRREWSHRMSGIEETHRLRRSCESIYNETFHFHNIWFHAVTINLDNCKASFCLVAYGPTTSTLATLRGCKRLPSKNYIQTLRTNIGIFPSDDELTHTSNSVAKSYGY